MNRRSQRVDPDTNAKLQRLSSSEGRLMVFLVMSLDFQEMVSIILQQIEFRLMCEMLYAIQLVLENFRDI